MSTTASRVASSRSTAITSRASSIHTGLPPSTQLARRPAGGRHEPHVALVGVGDLRAVGREARLGVLPVRRRLAAGGQPLGRPARSRSSSQTSEVSRSWMKTAWRRSAPSVSERGRGGRGDRLEPPVRRRLQVLARLGAARPRARRGRPRSTAAQRTARPPRCRVERLARRARRSSPGRSRPPARRRSGARARRARGRPRGSRRRVTCKRALGVAAGGVHAERHDQRPRARSRAPTPRARRPPRPRRRRRCPGASATLRFAPRPRRPSRPRSRGSAGTSRRRGRRGPSP